jgi:CubicO group peptidase (beta-lactamase class C family)
LHEPFQRYLPWFRVADAAASTRITLRRLLHHTGGLPERADYAAFVHPDLSDGALEDGVRDLRSVELSQPVGAGYQYSNSGYAILGLASRPRLNSSIPPQKRSTLCGNTDE